MSRNESSVSMPMHQIGTDQYWRGIFNKYDRDKDGRINYVELKGIIDSREYANDLPENVVDKIMELADRDNSGFLDFKEFMEMMHHPDLKAVFGHFVGRYVHSIIPNRRPVDTTGPILETESYLLSITGTWSGFRPVTTTDGGLKNRSVRKPFSNRVFVAEDKMGTSTNSQSNTRARTQNRETKSTQTEPPRRG